MMFRGKSPRSPVFPLGAAGNFIEPFAPEHNSFPNSTHSTHFLLLRAGPALRF
jgi:hypothetical protein